MQLEPSELGLPGSMDTFKDSAVGTSFDCSRLSEYTSQLVLAHCKGSTEVSVTLTIGSLVVGVEVCRIRQGISGCTADHIWCARTLGKPLEWCVLSLPF